MCAHNFHSYKKDNSSPGRFLATQFFARGPHFLPFGLPAAPFKTKRPAHFGPADLPKERRVKLQSAGYALSRVQAVGIAREQAAGRRRAKFLSAGVGVQRDVRTSACAIGPEGTPIDCRIK